MSTSIRLFEKESVENKSKEPDQVKSSDSSSNQNDGDAQKSSVGKKPDGKRRKRPIKKATKPEDYNQLNRILEMLTKSVIWTALIYGIGFALFIVWSIISGHKEHKNSERFYVSWQDFVHQMLAAGEVKELIVLPQYDYVRIILHDGAIINGERVKHLKLILPVANVDRFEQRLRGLEKRMGISESMLFIQWPASSIIIIYKHQIFIFIIIF